MLNEFKKFVLRGNVLDLAVGVIIGAAFSSVVNSLVGDVIMPLVGRLTGGVDFSGLFIALDGGQYGALAMVPDGVAVLKYGAFIQATVNFLIIAFSLFVIARGINRIRRPDQEREASKPVRKCPFCMGEIADSATRCPHCTSHLSDG